LLPGDSWERLEQTYAGAGVAENWEALMNTVELFRRVGLEVGTHLGYAYPDNLHQRVTAYVEHIKKLEPPTTLNKSNKQPQ
jgi:aminoglycoside 6-adenylyltransferase